MNRLPNIDFRQKYYWTAKKPVQIGNMLLAEDWNQFEAIDTCIEVIQTLSTVLTEVFGDDEDISGYLVEKTNEKYPSTSFLSTVNGSSQEKMNGISTIKINDDILTGQVDAHYLPSGVGLVNTLNGKTGNLNPILTGVSVNGVAEPFSTTIDLGYCFKQNQTMVSAINRDLVGDQWVVTSLVINDKTYSSVDNQYNLLVDDTFSANLFMKVHTLNQATSQPSLYNPNAVMNLQMFRPCLQLSTTLVANQETTLQNIRDWIAITNQNFDIIYPTSVNLDAARGILKITSPVNAILYYVSKIPN